MKIRALLAATVVGLSACSGEAASPAATFPDADGDALADALVERWIASVGGIEVYGRLESARYTLTTEIYDKESGRLRRTRPRYVTSDRTPQGERVLIERWEGDDFIAQGWDGQAEWATLNGTALAAGDKDFDEVRYVAGDVNYWIGLPYKLRDGGVNLHYRGVQDDGRHLVAVTFGEGVGLHDGDTWRYWFSEDQTLPLQIAYREEGKENWNLLRFEDVQTVDGYTFVGRRVHFDEEGRLTKVLHTHDFELNPDLDPAVFARP